MAEEGPPDKKRPRRKLSLCKSDKKTAGKNGKEGLSSIPSSSSIISLFNNAPPARIACPLCGQTIPRYRINQHMDEECKNNQSEDNVNVIGFASAVTPGPSAETGPVGSSPYFAAKLSTPEKNSGGDNLETKRGSGGQTSPYFKKVGKLALLDDQPRVGAIKNISLGSLSTRLSRRWRGRSRDGLIQDGQPSPTQVGITEQKLNQKPWSEDSLKENQLSLSRFGWTTGALNKECDISGLGQEDDSRSLSDGLNDSALVSLSCRELGLSRKGHQQVSHPQKNQDVRQLGIPSVVEEEGLTATYPREEPSKLESQSFSSNKPDPTLEEDYHHEMQKFSSSTGDATERLSIEDEAGARTEVEDEVCLATLEKAGFPQSSGNVGPGLDSAGHPYYLRNFLMVLEAVLENEDDRRLFSEEDSEVIARFYKLSASGQKLYVRLFQRKLAWIKTNKIEYAEISSDLSPVIQELVEAGFLQSEAELQNLSEVLDLLSAPELKTLAKAFHLKNPASPKQQLLDDFLQLARQRSIFGTCQAGIGSVILKRAKVLAGKCIKVCRDPRAVFSHVLLLFSLTDPVEEEEAGSGGQRQLSTVLMVNMGRTVFPTYTVNRKTPIFQDRDDFLRYAAAAHTSNDISVAMTGGNWEEARCLYEAAKASWQELKGHSSLSHHRALPEYLRRFTVGWLYTRILSQGVEILQRLRMFQEAVEQLQELLAQEDYCVDRRGQWWERLALNLHQHLKDTEKAVASIRKGLLDPFLRPGHQLGLSQRVQRMKDTPSCQKFKHLLLELPLLSVDDVTHVTIKGKLCPQTGMGKSVFILENQTEGPELLTVVCSVEELALAHYKQQGFDQGIHGEGSTFTALYGLLMWDILFMDGIPDVFRNSYQAFPLDLFTSSFYKNRQSAIEAKLQSVHDASTETLQTWVGEVWGAQKGKASALIGWDLFSSLQQAQSLVCCLGGPFLSGVCRRLSQDLRHCRGGLPDLVVWKTEDRQFKLVEVKGPGDRLSHKQMVWLDELQKLGASVEVCHVEAVGSKSQRLAGVWDPVQ
ncbi:fanconi-associated nuclease 1 [Pantherophis guttatus]|uniref:Fanconi-associated nuclease n=1 Tax=Pantherophis guttatus TaxID=94885 RepID=A0A6P9B6T6_PANGU|nr:fanconi-associated nuclease 1 [Pantherophis guttatus]XP_034265305.1 fanconi-associated nuclease 1 [Pantherophis guttatus]